MTKRCGKMLEKTGGTFEQCNAAAEAGSDCCAECNEIAKLAKPVGRRP